MLLPRRSNDFSRLPWVARVEGLALAICRSPRTFITSQERERQLFVMDEKTKKRGHPVLDKEGQPVSYTHDVAVVDDQDVIRNIMSLLLRRDTSSFITCADGREIVERHERGERFKVPPHRTTQPGVPPSPPPQPQP